MEVSHHSWGHVSGSEGEGKVKMFENLFFPGTNVKADRGARVRAKVVSKNWDTARLSLRETLVEARPRPSVTLGCNVSSSCALRGHLIPTCTHILVLFFSCWSCLSRWSEYELVCGTRCEEQGDEYECSSLGWVFRHGDAACSACNRVGGSPKVFQ